MPKLLFSAASPYSAKVRAAAAHAAIAVDALTVDTNADPDILLAANPLGKIPVLITDDGEASSTAGHHAVSQRESGGKLFPRNPRNGWRPNGWKRWPTASATVLLAHVYERRIRPEEKVHDRMDRTAMERKACARARPALGADPPKLPKKITRGTSRCAP
jgi:glutathione S-transferase